MVAHAKQVHKRTTQYHCSYCDVGGNYLVGLIQHMRRHHADKRTQPITCYQPMRVKNRHTLGFYCNHCEETSHNYQRMRQHIEVEHNVRYQYKCSHCNVSDRLERSIMGHAIQKHPGQPGLAMQQFERVANELLDSYNWELAANIDIDSPINNNDNPVVASTSTTETDTAVAVATIDDTEPPLEMIELILSSDEEDSNEQQCQTVPSSIDGQV